MHNTVMTLRAAGLSLAADIGELASDIEAAVMAAGTDAAGLTEAVELAVEDLYDVAAKYNTKYWDMVATGRIRAKKLPLATGGVDGITERYGDIIA